jgi:hypothetical protein
MKSIDWYGATGWPGIRLVAYLIFGSERSASGVGQSTGWRLFFVSYEYL